LANNASYTRETDAKNEKFMIFSDLEGGDDEISLSGNFDEGESGLEA
jgi:hypothetical protein